jgi:hypothetical protein
MICFTEVWFLQTYSPLRWSQRPGLFEPFPSLKRSRRPSEPFSSIKWDTKSTIRTTTTWCLTVHFYCTVADDCWRCVAVTPLAHRTVRCYTEQSGEL